LLLRKIFGLKMEAVRGDGENFIIRSFMLCIPVRMFVRDIHARGMKWAGRSARKG
jgi:hypothetical protein